MMVSGGSDTIAALATPQGRSAIALVRLSGEEAHAVAGRIATPWPLPERVARLCTLTDPASGTTIDHGIVTVYAGGRSYTGEPMVEIATHGGYLVPAATMAALIRAGAREALPGEFTRRAVLNGKLDILRAEAVGDLIDARSALMHRTALAQLDGGLSRRIDQLRNALIEIEALIAYDIDFPEEDDGPVERERVLSSCDRLLEQLTALLATAPTGELVREGAVVVLAGAPNAGKSSLYNALLGEARAIVTEIPGTTRDALEATIDADGWPLRLVDTAGLRDSTDALERLGIAASERYLKRAHVALACGETPAAVGAAIDRVRALTTVPIVGVLTKADLLTERHQHPDPGLVSPSDQLSTPNSWCGSNDLVSERHYFSQRHPDSIHKVSSSPEIQIARPAGNETDLVANCSELSRLQVGGLVSLRYQCSEPSRAEAPVPLVAASAVTGQGLGELRSAIVGVLIAQYGAPSAELPMLTRARHVRALETARDQLKAFRVAWHGDGLPAPVAAVHLRDAVVALEALIGAVDVEDVLDRVFGTFCVGK